MDGHFVPNITIGPLVVRAVRRSTSLPLDVHMMIASPERYVDEFVDAGADIITVHVEACAHLHRVVHQIRESGAKAARRSTRRRRPPLSRRCSRTSTRCW